MFLRRVLLTEDDASIRRFVELALEDLPIELVQAASVAQSLQRLREAGPFRLLITDLMLPDGSGMQLLQALAADPALRAGARVAVFSAGLSADRRAELDGLGVDEVIAKPASVGQLIDCVQRALGEAPGALEGRAATDDLRRAAVERYFAGDQGLYAAFRASCERQFVLDRRAGDAAMALNDLAAVRRLAHSLKTVLLTLGHEAESAWARQLETDAAGGDTEQVRGGWGRLALALDRLASP